MGGSLEGLIAYLDSVADLYPSGIGAADAERQPCSQEERQDRIVSWGNRKARVAIAAVAGSWSLESGGRPFGGENGRLLLGILEKGLGIAADQVHVWGLQLAGQSDAADNAGKLRRAVETAKGQILLVLGASAAAALGLDTLDFSERRGRPFSFGAGEAVLLYGLDEIRENKALKREFWENLKGVLSVL